MAYADVNTKSSIDQKSSSASQGSASGGYHASPMVNIAFPGASLEAKSSADGAPPLPRSLLWAAGFVVLAGGYLLLKKKQDNR